MEIIKILHETPNYLVISKPVGIAVHPGADRESYTIHHWLLQKYPEIEKLPWKTKNRIGIIHRLDKDTSGIMLLAKTPEALDFFQDQFRARKVEKYYTALVFGKLKPAHGFIDVLIKRDPKDRKRQKAEMIDFGFDEAEKKNSSTEYWVKKTYNYEGQVLSLLLVRIYTGRKHQIRTHMKFEGTPVMGDSLYFTKPSRRLSRELGLNRQFLHATKLKIKDFETKKPIEFEDKLSQDLQKVLDNLSTLQL